MSTYDCVNCIKIGSKDCRLCICSSEEGSIPSLFEPMPENYTPPKTQAKQFSTGAKRDNQDGKGRMDLLPWQAIIELSKHCENGAKHYGERNIDKGIPISNLMSSAFRHMAQYMEGAKNEDHLRAALWNIAWAMQFEVTKPEMQDIPNRKAQAFYDKEGVE